MLTLSKSSPDFFFLEDRNDLKGLDLSADQIQNLSQPTDRVSFWSRSLRGADGRSHTA